MWSFASEVAHLQGVMNCGGGRGGGVIYMLQVKGDQKVSVHLMITIQKVTSNVQSVHRKSPDIY
jgi:hypothetical protein